MKFSTKILSLFLILGCSIFASSCEKPDVPQATENTWWMTDPAQDARFTVEYDFPASGIWGLLFANAGQVPDLGSAYPVGPNSQTRQLPSRKAGELLFPTTAMRPHFATVDYYVWDGPYLAGYWMDGVTTLHINRPDLGIDTVLNLAPCRFFAGTDSYESPDGYVMYNRPRNAAGELPITKPRTRIWANSELTGIYSPGDTLPVAADCDANGVIQWWVTIPFLD